MKSIVTFTAMILMGATALATPSLDPATLAKAQRATLVLDDVAGQSYCTVFPITPDGYALTALHCVRDCLVENAKAETGSNSFVGLNDLLVVGTPGAVNATCDLQVASLKIKNVTVVATGPGLSIFDENFLLTYTGLFDELRAQGLESRANDFALIKLPVTQPVACLPIHAQGSSPGQNIAALGYPLPADPKQPAPFSQAPGSVYNSSKDSRYYAGQASAAQRTLVERVYSSDGVIYSNANTTFGYSGGPIVALDGSAIGVVSGFTTTELTNTTELHELVGTSMARVLAKLPANISSALIQKSVACK